MGLKHELDKAQKTLRSLVRKRKKIGRLIKKNEKRLQGADRDVLKRRFQYDLDQLNEQLAIVHVQERWTKNQIHRLEVAYHTNRKGDLIHRPFEHLSI
jgi:hypothetical protein